VIAGNEPNRETDGNWDVAEMAQHEENISIIVGSHVFPAKFDDSVLVADFGTTTLTKGQSATIDGKVVYVGHDSVLVDGVAAVFTDPTRARPTKSTGNHLPVLAEKPGTASKNRIQQTGFSMDSYDSDVETSSKATLEGTINPTKRKKKSGAARFDKGNLLVVVSIAMVWSMIFTRQVVNSKLTKGKVT
jgi:hypothetical protein